jgi:lysophospholipase L1-like esterase
MHLKLIHLILICLFCLKAVGLAVAQTVPANLFNIGDSIGVGEAADGTIGEASYDAVWSTGYDPEDVVLSLNERLEAMHGDRFYENNAARNSIFNHAMSGAQMADFEDQANAVIAAIDQTPGTTAGMVTVLMGANDVCAANMESMTPVVDFEAQYRAGLNALANSDTTRNAYIHISGIPAIYWLWSAKHNNDRCRNIIWPFVPCENLLDRPLNDCGAGNSQFDPDTIRDDDGPNCVRRKQFHAKIRDLYNPLLENVLQEYIEDGRLPNAYYVNIFDIRFDAEHVNNGDCFHPSLQGQALMAQQQWLRSYWGQPESNGEGLFFPIKTKAGKVTIIYLE